MNKLFKWIAHRLIQRALHTPYYHLTGYMNRYWLVPYGGGNLGVGCGQVSFWRRPIAYLLQRLGIAVRIHHILRSDTDDAYHDHPWPYVSVILRGYYYEITPAFTYSGIYVGPRVTYYGPGSILFRRANSWHRLVLAEGQTACTLFITGPKCQAWGFLPNPKSKIYYREYLNKRSRS